MAKHKAPTQISVASLQEKTFLHEFVERYWKTGVVLALAITVAILVPVYRGRQAREVHHSVWDALSAQANLSPMGGIQGGTPEALSLFAEEHRGSPVGGWAKGLEVGALVNAENLDEAQRVASQIPKEWPDHLLSTAKLYPGPNGESLTLGEAIRSGEERMKAWEKEHANLFSNPPLPADAPRVRIQTSKGPIVVGLYVDRAPKHAENFLAQCREKHYDGTKFHRVVRGSLIQGGDPNTVSGDPESWGLGGTADAVEPEIDPKLRHFKGTLSAWKSPGTQRSHASQFMLTTEDQHSMDGQYTVFGTVLEGQATIEAIASAAVVGDRPQDPVLIESTEIL